MSKIHIRPLEPGDRPAWDQLWAQYLEYYEAELTDEMSELTWNRALNGDRIYGLIAFDGEKAVGMTHYLFHPSTWSESDVCYLEDLVVDSDYRGKSIGRALIEAVYAAADDAAGKYRHKSASDL